MVTRVATIAMNRSRLNYFLPLVRFIPGSFGVVRQPDCLISVKSCLLTQFNPLLRL
jgi:hypothetical protein